MSYDDRLPVSTHSRPKAAGAQRQPAQSLSKVSTHSRPKAAGRKKVIGEDKVHRFNSQPPEGGWGHTVRKLGKNGEFQLTAARRRLAAMVNGVTS